VSFPSRVFVTQLVTPAVVLSGPFIGLQAVVVAVVTVRHKHVVMNLPMIMRAYYAKAWQRFGNSGVSVRQCAFDQCQSESVSLTNVQHSIMQ
jgi:hypothetical protein